MLDNQSCPHGVRDKRSLLRVALLATLTLVLIGLAGCGTSRPPTTALRLPLYGPLGSPDPALVSTPAGEFLDSLLYSGLVKYGPDLHVVPELAVSLPTISGSGLVYTFTIRQDCRFADGRPCTAADVAYSLARALRPAVHSRHAWNYFHDIEGAEAVWNGSASNLAGVTVMHRLTVRIRLIRPDADFLQRLADPVGSLVERQRLPGPKIAMWSGPDAGTGPWSFTGKDRNGALVLSPRHHFYGVRLQVRTLNLIPVRGTAAGLSLYRKGALDVAQISEAQFGRYSGKSGFHSSPGLDAYYAIPSSPVPVLDTRLNHSRLVQHTSPALTPLESIVPPTVPDYVPPTVGADPSASAEQIAAIRIQAEQPMEGQLRTALLAQWGPFRRTGSTIRLIHVWKALPDPSSWLHLVLPETQSIWFRHLLTHADRLTNDPVTRMATYSRCESWALQQGFVVPLASGSVAYLIKPSVQNLQVTPFGLMPANNSWATVTLG